MAKKKAKPKLPRIIRLRGWGAWIPGNAFPDETFPSHWAKSHVRRFLKTHRNWTKMVIRPIKLSYIVP